MGSYLFLCNVAEGDFEGGETPAAVLAAAVESAGGALRGLWTTHGAHDVVALAAFASDSAADEAVTHLGGRLHGTVLPLTSDGERSPLDDEGHLKGGDEGHLKGGDVGAA